MNQITVKTTRTLSETEIDQIRDIMLHSNCPNESLIESTGGCLGFVNGDICIGEEEEERSTLVVEY